jgi:hypothetical protein
MRKLKLQMNMTIDSFVARPNGDLDWMKLEDWDDELNNCANELIDSSDIIVKGRKMTDEFVNYWTKAVENPESPEYEFAKKMVDTPKVVFTKTLDESEIRHLGKHGAGKRRSFRRSESPQKSDR